MAESFIYGAPAGATTVGWSHVMVDRSVALPAGATISKLGVFSKFAKSYALKIAREVTASSYEVVAAVSVSHPGGSVYVDAELASPFVVPASGVYRLMTWTGSASPASSASGSVVRATKASGSDVSGTVTGLTGGTAPLPPMRAVVTDNSPPPPPPPPPPPGPTTPHYVFLIAGQSNALAFGGSGAAAFRSRFLQLVPNCTVETVNAAVGSSYMAQGVPAVASHWQLGGGLLENAIAEYQGALDGNPNAVPGGIIWFQGEAESRSVRGGETLAWPKGLKAVIAALRTSMNRPNLPVLITELHEQPSAAYPLWPDVQWMQRMSCNPTEPYTFIPGCVLVSAKDLNATTDDGLHLASSALQTLGVRYAEAIAPIILSASP